MKQNLMLRARCLYFTDKNDKRERDADWKLSTLLARLRLCRCLAQAVCRSGTQTDEVDRTENVS